MIHRTGWVILVLLSIKLPKVKWFFYYYEMVAIVIECILVNQSNNTEASWNFIILYIVLMNVLVYVALCNEVIQGVVSVLVHAIIFMASCLWLSIDE